MSNFYKDTLSIFDSDINRRVAGINFLEPVIRKAVSGLITTAWARHTINLQVFETYRSRQRQELLFKQGATKLQKVGVHHYGLAVDLVKNIGGEISWKGDWTFLRALAKEFGLIWGGDWGFPDVKHDFVDAGHLQRCSKKDEGKLFAETWYPEDSYNPYLNL